MNENHQLDLPSAFQHAESPILRPQANTSPQLSSLNSFQLQVPDDQNPLSSKIEPVSSTSTIFQDEPTAETENLPNSASTIPLDLTPSSRSGVEDQDQTPVTSSIDDLDLEDPASQEHITYRGPQNTADRTPVRNQGEQRQNPAAPIRDHTSRLRFFNTFPARRTPVSDEEADDLLNRAFEGYVYLIIIYVFSILVLKEYLSFYCFLSFAIVTCIGQIATILRSSDENRALTNRQKIMKYFQVIDWLLLTLFILVAGFQVHWAKIPLSPFTLPGFINAILFYFYSNDGTNSLMRKSTISLLKLLFWTQILLISFKADDIIENWLLVFIELFYTLVFLMAVSVGFFIVAVCYLCKNRDSGYFDYDVVGLVWYILNAFHSWVWGLILLGLLEELRNNEDDSILIYGLIIGLVHSVILVVFTMVFEKKILIYLSFTLQQIIGNIEAPKGVATFQTNKENIGYLLKISPTYFMMINKSFRMKDKELPEACKQQIKEVKQQKKLNQNLKELMCNRVNSESSMLESSSTTTNTTKLHNTKTKPRKILTENLNRTLSLESKKQDDLYYSDDDAEALSQVQNLRSQNNEEGENCIICCLNQPNAVFMGCGHGGVCHGCAIEAWKNGDNCVFCRQHISKILKVTMLNRINIARVIEGTRKKFRAVPFVEDQVEQSR